METASKKILKKQERAEKRQKKIVFRKKKDEMKNLINQAYKTYKNDFKKFKNEDKKTLKNNCILWKNNQKEIINKYKTKQIDKKTFIKEMDSWKTKLTQYHEDYAFSLKNHILLVTSEYKRTIVQIQKTYMDDVISKTSNYIFKRWLFGINKEFTRVSWWSRKRVLLDFIIIIIIITILALLFFGIDILWMRLK